MAIKISGVTIIDDSRNIVSGAAATFTSNVTIGGTLTYEDVTNVDSIGIITARQDVHIGDSIVHIGDTDTKIIFTDNVIQLQGGGTTRLKTTSTGIQVAGRLNIINNNITDTTNSIGLRLHSGAFQPTDGAGNLTNGTKSLGTSSNKFANVYATTLYGDGANLTGITAQGIGAIGGLTIKNQSGSVVGTGGSISTLDFNGSSGVNVTATSGAAGIATILISSTGFFEKTDVGINTVSKVGIGTTNPIAQLDVNVGSSVTALNIEGSEGQLFSVTNNLSSGSIFAVNDITGLPSVDVNADGTIQLAPRGAGELVGIGTTSPTSKVHIVGDTLTSGIATFASSIHVADSIIHEGDTDTKIDFATNQIKFTASNRLRIHLASNAYNYLYGTQLIEADSTNPKPGGATYVARFRDTTGDDTEVQFFNTNVKNTILSWNDTGNTSTAGNLIFKSVSGGTGIEHARFTGTGSFNLAKDFSVAGVSTFSDDIKIPVDNKKLIFGVDEELSITHTGSNSDIVHAGTGRLRLLGNYFTIGNSAGNQDYIRANLSSSVTLYHSGNAKIQTQSDGAAVIGILTATSITSPKYDGDADRNIIMGCCAGIAITDTVTDATRNVIIGCSAGRKVCTGFNAVIIGACAGHELTDAGSNVIMGEFAACKMCCGFNNVVIGKRAGMGLTGRISCADSSLGANSNVFIGSYTGNCTRRECNTFVGPLAGQHNSSGQHNTFIGVNAGKGPSSSAATNTGYANVYLGSGAGISARGGSYNVAIGRNVGMAISTGGNHIFIGCGAGVSQISGFNNIFMGNLAGACVTTGAQSIFMGQQAGRLNVSGGLKIAIGDNAGEKGMGDTSNGGIAIGYCAQRCSTCGSGNVALGNGSGKNLTCGQNIMIGGQTGVKATAAHGNTFMGSYAAGCFTTGQRNTFIGCQAGFGHTVGTFNVMLGACSGPRTCGAVGECNIFIGGYTASAMCCGLANITIGTHAGQCLRNAYCNIFLGRKAGLGQTSGKFNFYVGNHAGPSNCGAKGCDNVGLGRNTMRLSTGAAHRNIAIGLQAGYCVTGNYNILFGCGAGELITSGSNNIVIGCGVDVPSATGNRQLAIGEGTGRWIEGDSSYNVCLAGSTIKAMASGGIFCATKFCGDGSCLTDAGEIIKDAKCNIFTRGTCSGCNLDLTLGTGAHFNIMIGECAGRNMTCGDGNILMGKLVGRNITTGKNNIFLGEATGCCTISGCHNFGVGVYTLNQNTGNHNIAIGSCAGKINESGGYNIFFGCGAGRSNTTGGRNIAIGRDVCLPSATDNDQFAIGCGSNRWIEGDSSYKVTLAGIVTATAGGAVCANSTTLKAYAVDTDIFSITRADHASSKLFRIFQDSSSGGGAGGPHINTFNRNLMITASASAATDSGVYLRSSGQFGVGTNNPTSKLSVAGDACVSGVSTFLGNVKVGAGVTLHARGEAAFAGVSTFSACVSSYNDKGAIHLPTNRMLVLGANYLYGAIYQAGAQLTFQALNTYRFRVWDGGGMKDWMNVNGVGGMVKIGGCSAGLAGSSCGTHTFMTQPHKITMCSSVPDSSTCTRRFELDSYGIQLTGITTITGNLNTTGISTFGDDVTFTGASSNVVFDKSDNSLEFASNAKIKLHGGSYMTTLHSDGTNAYLCHSGLSAFFVKSNDFQITGAGVRQAGLSYDGTIFRVRTGIVELGYEFGNGDAGIKLRTSGIGITVTGQIDTTDINASGVVTATSFVGDGSQLTGISGGGGISTTFFESSAAGIHTLSKVGIGTAIPEAQLDVNVGSGVTAFNVSGSEGQLFSVTNNLTSGSIFEVNDVSGMPSIDVDADGTIQLAPHGTGELVGIGTTVPTSKLHVVGDTLVTGVSTFSGDITGAAGVNLNLDSTFGNNYSDTYSNFDGRLIFDNSYSDTFRGPNRIQLYGTNTWIGGFGISNNHLDIYTGGNVRFIRSTGTNSYSSILNLDSSGNLDVSGELDVDGHTELDNLNVSGVTTFTNGAGVADFKPIQLEKSATTGATRIQFLENGTNKGGITYSHDNNRIEILTESSGKIRFQDVNNSQFAILDGTGLTVNGSEHKFTSGTSGDLSLILESDTDNNNEADNPKILFRQDGTQDLNSIGLNFSGHIARDNNSLYLASSGSQSGIVFLTGTSDGYTNATEKLRITPTGEVGIGISTPTSKLHVVGDTLVTGVSTFSDDIKLPDDKVIRLGVKNSTPNGELTFHHSSADVNYITSPTSRTLQILGNGGVLMRGSGNENIAYFRQSSIQLYHQQTLTVETTSEGIEVGTGVTIERNGQATFVGVVTFGSSSTTIDGNSDTINVGTALTLGHTQGLQFHTQNLHSTGFEVNNINATGIITATNFTKTDGTPIASTDIAINTLSSSSATGGGSASFNGTAYRFTLSEPPDTSVYQLFVSINGVIQKPNAGSSQPSEGFAIDGNDIIFGSPPPAGSPFFIQTFKTVGISSIPPQAQVSTTSAAKSVKNVTTSTSAPTNSNGVDGDLWFTYIA